MTRVSTKVNDERHEQKAHNRDDLNGGEDEFSFAIDGDCKDVQTKDHYDNQRDPGRDVDMIRPGPILNNDGGG